jgi:hypothetical protein
MIVFDAQSTDTKTLLLVALVPPVNSQPAEPLQVRVNPIVNPLQGSAYVLLDHINGLPVIVTESGILDAAPVLLVIVPVRVSGIPLQQSGFELALLE